MNAAEYLRQFLTTPVFGSTKRSLWQRIPVRVRAQAARFGRLFVVALVSQALALQGQHLTRSVVLSAVVGAVEVAWRQWRSAPDAAQHRGQ